MGLAGSYPYHEGYGQTRKTAVQSLDAMLRYHYDAITVRQVKEGDCIRYFVWDDTGERTIYYDRDRGLIRAFIIL